MKKNLLRVIISLLIVAAAISCQKEPELPPQLEVNSTSLAFLATGETKTLEIESNIDWTISIGQGADWLTVDPTRGTGSMAVKVTATANSAQEARTTTLTLSGAGVAQKTITINQAVGVAEPNKIIEFKDPKFKAAVLRVSEAEETDENYDGHIPKVIDSDGDGEISQQEAAAVQLLSISYAEITDLSGIEYFTGLMNLYCNDNDITSIDLSKATMLELLNCNFNDITALDLSANTKLVKLAAEANKIASELDLSNNTMLDYLNVAVNQIPSIILPESSALEYIQVNNNKLTSLDVKGSDKLELLWCHSNDLTELVVTGSPMLLEIAFDGNDISEIDLSSNRELRTVLGARNQLTEIELSNAKKLASVDLQRNAIEIVSLPNTETLVNIDMSQNMISTIALNPYTQLDVLDLSENFLEEIDINKNLALTYLGLSRNRLLWLDISEHAKLAELYCGRQSDMSGNPQDIALTMTQAQFDAKVLGDDDLSDIKVTIKGAEPTENIEFVSAAFKAALLDGNRSHNPRNIDENLDGEISVAEAARMLQIDLDGAGIKDASDIKYFTSVSALYIENNEITTLDLSPLTMLGSLYASSNLLTSMDLSRNVELTNVFLTENKLTSVDLTKNEKLRGLLIDNNHLESIDLSKNIKLEGLYIHRNRLTKLDLSYNTLLKGEELFCGDQSDESGADITMTLELNQDQINAGIFNASSSSNARVNVVLKGFDPEASIQFNSAEFKSIVLSQVDSNSDGEVSYSEAAAANSLDFWDTGLTDASDIRHFVNVTSIDFDDNNLTTIDLTFNTKLAYLYASNNQLTSLNVTQCSALQLLRVENNKLETINLSNKPDLRGIVANNNKLLGIDLSECTSIVGIQVYGNHLVALNISKNLDINEDILCGNQTSESGDPRTMELILMQSQVDAGIFKADIPENTRVTLNVLDAEPISNVRYSLLDIPTDGSTIEGDHWIITDASGSYDDFASLRSALKSAGRAISLEFPNIASLPISALFLTANIASVKLTEATEIGTEAFFGVESIVSIDAPKLTKVVEYAFSGCSALTEVNLPLAQTIEVGAFRSCSALTTISLPSASIIGSQAFSNCTALASVSLPAVTSLGSLAFRWSRAITSLELSTNSVVSAIDASAFTATTTSSIALTVGTSSGLAVDGTSFSFAGNTYGPFLSIATK